jgi:hypothetical protein
VIQARSPEAFAQLVAEALVLAENDASDEATPLTGEARRDSPRDAFSQAVSDAGDAAAVPDDPVAIRSQDDVHPLTAQVLGLVERAVALSGARCPNRCDQLEDGALRRRAFGCGQLELRRLVDLAFPELQNVYGDARREWIRSSGPDHLRSRQHRRADLSP